jgi:UDP-3-O-[3-hydroxymyristoyl] glucosamine N-acyltransferase
MLNFNLNELCAILGTTEYVGYTDVRLTNLNRIEHSSTGDITFLSNNKYLKYLETTYASCVLIDKHNNNQPKDNQVFIKVDDPYVSFVQLIFLANEPEQNTFEIHPSAVIEQGAFVSAKASIGANCYIGKNVSIDEGVIIKSNCSIQQNVKIGKNTLIHSNVVIYKDCEIGDNCIIHSGVVIGADGFGYIENSDGSYSKIPQIGNVVIGNNVEIGANTTIDRSLIGSTYISDGVKLDNLIQIGHNVEVGENSVMAAQVGVSGSAKIGKRNRFGGQVGIAGHLEIADDVIIMAQSGVAKSVTQKGMYFGSPIKDRITAFKIEAVIPQLPQIYKDINLIKKKLDIK